MIKQCKGKDLDNVPASKLLPKGWYLSTKYDGNYVQIHKLNDSVRFFTSGGKEFYHELAADALIKNNPNLDFILEAEFTANTVGKLGDRVHAAKLTTYRTNFTKGLANIGLSIAGDTFRIFDVIILHVPWEERFNWLVNIYKQTEFTPTVNYTFVDKLETAQLMAKKLVQLGYEGAFIKHMSHSYEPGKRLNTAIKLKYRKTADLKCVDIIEGEGKYRGMIGALVLTDEEGKTVCVGSGLDDNQRGYHADSFIGKVIEIAYEQVLDTYIQPTFVCIRDDK